MNLENPNSMNSEETALQDTKPEEDKEMDLREIAESTNIASHLSDDELRKLGNLCKRGFEYDQESRSDFMDALKDWQKLATLMRETKNFPWEDASNIKYPLITTAAMQFSARSYPTLVPSDGMIVKGRVVGKDPDGAKNKKANRVAKYISWQIMFEMDNWEADFDRQLMRESIKGNEYKKTYYDPTKGHNVSKVVQLENLVVNYWANSLEEAERISEIFLLYPRQVENRKRAGMYLDIDLGSPIVPDNLDTDNKAYQQDPEFLPYTFIEQHTYYDLNKDGHQEPYIVVFELATGKVVRITARFDKDGVVVNDKNKVVEVRPIQYYTKYGFIPNPDGSFLDLGFGALLGPLNEALNTSINQLTDSGTLSNMQSGFLGKGLRVKGGDYRMQPGEWKWVNASGDDLRKQIVQIPAKDPSTVLFQLLQFLLTAGKELASVAEIFVGKMPGQNTPATTTMASIEQGMKVFTAIYKRVYRSLDQEFKKLFELNAVYLDEEHYKMVTDDPEASMKDFDLKGFDIIPAADPQATSQQERLSKAMAPLELIPLGTIDVHEATIRVLQAQDQPNWEKLIPGLVETGKPAPPPPDPKAQEMQMKMQAIQQGAQVKAQSAEHKAKLDSMSAQGKLAMQAQESAIKVETQKALANAKLQEQVHNQKIFMADSLAKVGANQVDHTQKVVHTEQQHNQKMQHNEESQKSKLQSQKATSKSGKKAK